MLGLLQEGLLGVGPGAVDPWWLLRQIAHAAKRDKALADEVLRLYQNAASGPQHGILEHAIEEIGGAPGVIALVHGYARTGNRFDGSMHQALRHTAIEEHPIPGSSAYNLHPVSVEPLRKQLFSLMHGDDARVAAVAEGCLANIDTLRDHFGMVESEPRHPDVASGKPWPRSAEGH